MAKKQYHNLSDSDLVAAVKSGDTCAYDTLFLRWYPQVLKFITSLVKDYATAEDLCQVVFMKVWIYRDRLDALKSFKNYLFILARNAALDILKLRKLHLDINMNSFSESEESRALTEQCVERNEVNMRILKVTKDMPLKRRQVFHLSRIMALSNDEIAEKMGISVRTVEKHIQLALKDIRKILS